MNFLIDPYFDPDIEPELDRDTASSVDEKNLAALQPISSNHPAVPLFELTRPSILKILEGTDRCYVTLYLSANTPAVIVGADLSQTLKRKIRDVIPADFKLVFDGGPELY
jgi:hypothetical protein